MKKAISKLAVGTALAVLAIGQVPAHAVGDTGDAGVIIAVPLTLTKHVDMDFGTLSVGPSGGTIDSHTQALTGDVISVAGPIHNAIWAVDGRDNTAFTVTLPASINIAETGGALMNVSLVNQFPPLTGPLGNGAISVRGTLGVNGLQTPGLYTGTFVVSANY